MGKKDIEVIRKLIESEEGVEAIGDFIRDIKDTQDPHFYAHLNLEDYHPSIVSLILKFRSLDSKVRSRMSLLEFVLGNSSETFKMRKEGADYVSNTHLPGKTCSTCKYLYQHYKTGKLGCSRVGSGKVQDDTISPSGWCNLWEE